MSYRIKRIDPFWLKHPAIGVVAVAAGAIGLFGVRIGSTPLLVAGALACGTAVFMATKPALSAVFAVFGLLGGVVAFLAGSSGGLSPLTRLAATAGFGVFYMMLMDVLVLGLAVVYNQFTRVGFSGLSLNLES